MPIHLTDWSIVAICLAFLVGTLRVWVGSVLYHDRESSERQKIQILIGCEIFSGAMLTCIFAHISAWCVLVAFLGLLMDSLTAVKELVRWPGLRWTRAASLFFYLCAAGTSVVVPHAR